MSKFKLHAEFKPTGDQPQAIEKLTQGVESGMEHQVLLGVTGSGKTFTMANVIEKTQRPTLIISHNKTLAAQLFQEFREFFPENEVHYFVSYYDYYQPEAYLPQRDLYIEKEVSINKEIERLRHSATQALMSREDVIVIASVSCIYGLGRPEDYQGQSAQLQISSSTRSAVLQELIKLLYQRNDWDLQRGCFRVRGDTIEVLPPYGTKALRLEFLGEELEKISWIDPTSSELSETVSEVNLFPAKHFITSEERLKQAAELIQRELDGHVIKLQLAGRALEAQRLKQRTEYDLELMGEMGFCPGIENYSRYLTGRQEGEPPYTLLDYFRYGHNGQPRDFLCIIDESHMAVPQIRGMYNGDRARKDTLVEFGFRLPSARDNRPLNFSEFHERVSQTIYTSATPAEWEIEKAGKGGVVEQLTRPTGLLDPKIEIRPTKNQIKNLIQEVLACKERGERVLVTTLTKRMAEDLAEYLADTEKIKKLLPKAQLDKPIAAQYLHSDIKTLERSDTLADLRRGKHDVLVGINLLREGLDLPEVSLVAILDADKEGFLRSKTSLVQTMGRAARNVRGRAILYADKITGSIEGAVTEIERRRQVQKDYNRAHGITPATIQKPVRARLVEKEPVAKGRKKEIEWQTMPPEVLQDKIWEWEREMRKAAEVLDFEKAAKLRDTIREAEGSL